MNVESRAMIAAEFQVDTTTPRPRRTSVLRLVGVAPSSWHRPAREGERKRPGPAPRRIADEVVQAVVEMATANPWYGYKRIAVMCRRAGAAVKDREAYLVMRDGKPLHKPRPRDAELHQAAKLFELCNRSANPVPRQVARFELKRASGWV
ncbi:MAG: hypothetical protein AB7U73_19970 [Pirellulales bacterium]